MCDRLELFARKKETLLVGRDALLVIKKATRLSVSMRRLPPRRA
jgi:hypothetical protein